MIFPLLIISDIYSDGNITMTNVIPINTVVSESSMNSTNGDSAEIEISNCKIPPSKSLNKGFDYGFNIRSRQESA